MHEQVTGVVRKAASRVFITALCLLVSGILSATLVRYAPGFLVDERELDPRLNTESIASIRQEHEDQRHVLRFYVTYLRRTLHGDFGTSSLFRQPIAQLIKDRWAVTVWNICGGLVVAWTITLAIAFIAVTLQQKVLDVTFSALLSGVLCLPAAVIALLVAMARWPATIAVATAVLPVLYRYTRNVLQNSWSQPWILGAFAKGIGPVRVVFSHVVPVAASELIALGGVSFTLAFSAAVPIEVLTDSPGVGQLAWQAAMGRDLPLVVTVTGLVAALSLSANGAATLVNEVLEIVRG
jgi:peptide/nickel transport system permease protein